MSAVVLALPESAALARRVSELAAMPLGTVESRQFPDGETYLRIDAECAHESVVLVCTLDRPNPKVLPLVFLADAARAAGARRVGLVAPYLAYLRQDRQFRPGEDVRAALVGVRGLAGHDRSPLAPLPRAERHLRRTEPRRPRGARPSGVDCRPC